MIAFYVHELDFVLLDQRKLKAWITDICTSEQVRIGEISYVFCSDDYLLEINRQHLQHDYYTDIITFDLGEEKDVLYAELYLSVDRIRENASENRVSFADELHRVMIHGIWHLLGQGDKTEAEARQMRQREEAALAARMFHVKHYR